MSQIPKFKLIEIIRKEFNSDLVKSYFKIQDRENWENRLTSLSIKELQDFINSNDVAKIVLKNSLSEFPLRSSPTLYLVIKPLEEVDFANIKTITRNLAKKLRTSGLFFFENKQIRVVYCTDELKKVSSQTQILELKVSYEKQIEYTEWNPAGADFRESKYIFSLENAFVWLPKKESNFGIIATCDFVSVKPIILYLKKHLGISFSLPFLSQEMLKNIATGGVMRNATFGATLQKSDSQIDSKSLTIYDDSVTDTKIYQSIKDNREQNSGFYINHPAFLRSGIGISRRYGRIWSPAHLSKNELLNLSLDIIQKVKEELKKSSQSNIRDFITFYSNSDVLIGKTKLVGEERKIFDALIRNIINANKEKSKKIIIGVDLLKELIKTKNTLKMVTTLQYECTNCGTEKAYCKSCGLLLDLIFKEDSLSLFCEKCKTFFGDQIDCSCGEEIHLPDLIPNVILLPNEELIIAIKEYYKKLHPNLKYPGSFIVINTELHILASTSNSLGKISLKDLNIWKNSAKIQHYYLRKTKTRELALISGVKEKCNINGYHPTKDDCKICLSLSLTIDKIDSLCLLRIFGIPISKGFDGIHHGYEGADIEYSDYLDEKEVRIGLHIKSHSKSNQKNGIGRSNRKIKELYAQLFYTLYEQKIKKQKYDIVGIGIPNNVSKTVIDSMSCIANEHGLGFLPVEKEDWASIFASAKDSVRDK